MTGRAIRMWDKTSLKMLYLEDMGAIGVFFTAEGAPVQYKAGRFVALQNVELMYHTGMNTDEGLPIWEADVLDVDIPNDFGSFMRARGFMAWDGIMGKWVVNIPSGEPRHDFVVAGGKVVGNLFEQPDIINQKAP